MLYIISKFDINIKYKEYFVGLILFLIHINLMSQTTVYRGEIVSDSTKAIPFANIIINNSTTSKNITFTYTDKSGIFSVKLHDTITKAVFNVSAIGFEEKNDTLKLIKNKPIYISLKKSTTALKEVVVRARKNKDTLDLKVANLNLTEENTLRDILNKTDGVIISEKGGITFQGRKITKVLINNKEVFINQNKVALDNVNVGIVKDAQIINNYSDKFSLNFDQFKNPVINIDTKEAFKGILKTEIEAGGGYKNAFEGNLKMFYFSDKLNTFITSNNNNFGSKAIELQDAQSDIYSLATSIYKNQIFPFYIENNQLKENFVSHNSLTIRKENKKNRLGMVFYHGYIDQTESRESKTFERNSKFSENSINNTQNGNFTTLFLNYQHLLSKKTLLKSNLNFGGLWGNKKDIDSTTILIEQPSFSIINTQESPQNLNINAHLNLSHKISDNHILKGDINVFSEKGENEFNSFHSINNELIYQKRVQNKRIFEMRGVLDTRLKKGRFQSGIIYKKNISSYELTNDTAPQKENQNYHSSSVLLKYDTNFTPKTEFSTKIIPTLLHFENSKGLFPINWSQHLKYSFKGLNYISFNYSTNYETFPLHSLVDTLALASNQIVINKFENKNSFTKNKSISLQWQDRDIVRSRFLFFNYEYSKAKNFESTVLDSVSQNIFYYSRRTFDKQQSHLLNGNFSKGYYLGKKYHSLKFYFHLNNRYITYPTISNSMNGTVKYLTFSNTFGVSFEPRKFFLRSITTQLKWNPYKSWVNNVVANSQNNWIYSIHFKGGRKDFKGDLDILYNQFITNEATNIFFDLNLSILHKIGKNIKLSLTGKSIFTLLGINNYRFVNTYSNGNLVIQNQNQFNLGYLLGKISMNL